MNIFKIIIYNKMKDNFLVNSLNLFIEMKVAMTFGTRSIINDFCNLNNTNFSFDRSQMIQ